MPPAPWAPPSRSCRTPSSRASFDQTELVFLSGWRLRAVRRLSASVASCSPGTGVSALVATAPLALAALCCLCTCTWPCALPFHANVLRTCSSCLWTAAIAYGPRSHSAELAARTEQIGLHELQRVGSSFAVLPPGTELPPSCASPCFLGATLVARQLIDRTGAASCCCCCATMPVSARNQYCSLLGPLRFVPARVDAV